jgi:hypothetical protein
MSGGRPDPAAERKNDVSSELTEFNAEPAEDRHARRARVKRLTAGKPGADGLTDLERQLLQAIRRDGLDIRHGWLANERSGEHWRHGRVIVVGAPSWVVSQR